MPSLFSSLTLVFDYPLNDSLQVGDQVYWSLISSLGGFLHDASSTVTHVGEVTQIDSTPFIPAYPLASPPTLEVPATYSITVATYHVDSSGNPLPGVVPPVNTPPDTFISFSKDNVVNNNDLTGYYASVHFLNNSDDKVELFSVGAGISESSK